MALTRPTAPHAVGHTTGPHPTAPREPLVRRLLGANRWVLPVVLTIVTLAAGQLGHIPENMIGGLAVITGIGMLLGPLGNAIPVVNKIGGPALLCLMVPSILVALGVFSQNTLNAVTVLMKGSSSVVVDGVKLPNLSANFLYLVISTLVVGSIIGMNRQTMLKGLAKIFVPLVVGTLSAVAVGVGVAMAFGYSLERAFFFIVVPIIGGGIGEGILPLSISYSTTLGIPQEELVAQLIPAAVIGNIVAIVTAGVLRRLGERRPHLDGGGDLVRVSPETKAREAAVEAELAQRDHVHTATPNPALGVLVIMTMFVLGTLAEPVLHLPAPVLVILFSVLAKLLHVFPATAEEGVRAVYKVVSGYFIYPLMVGLGMLYIPLDGVVSVLTPGYVLACTAVVLTMAATGFLVGRWLGMYPIDSSLVTVCHSGLGGTGDVAILSASQRMVLMPFAQISTRLGGVTTVIAASSLLMLTI